MNVAPPVLIFTIAILAGCVDGTADDAGAAAFPDANEDGAGAVQGLVVDDQFTPLAGVRVGSSASADIVVTDAAGRFALTGLPPGDAAIFFERLGFESTGRSVLVQAGQTMELQVALMPLPIQEPYHSTSIQSGLIGCGILLKTTQDPNASHNLLAACGVFGNMGYYNVDKFHLAWPFGALDETVGGLFETRWDATQSTGKGLGILYTLWDTSNTAGGVYTFGRRGGESPLDYRVESDTLAHLLEEQPTIYDCQTSNCTVHTYHYGRASTLGDAYPYDAGMSLQQKFEEFLTLFYNQQLPTDFTALPDQ